jgi:hypothetical protein
MADVHNASLAGGVSSAELAVTPLAPLGLTTDKPCTVYVKNTVTGGPTWSVLFQAGTDDARVIYPTATPIKITNHGSTAARVLLVS